MSSTVWVKAPGVASLRWVLPALLGACALAALCALLLGPSGSIGLGRLLAELASGTGVSVELRAPRVVLAAVVGGSLALAGVGMQALLENELADPYVLGVSGGAALGGVSSLALAPALPHGLGAAAGAFIAASAVVRLARSNGARPNRLLLCGVALGSSLTSVTGLVLMLSPRAELVRPANYWLFGGFVHTSPWLLAFAFAVLCGGAGWMWRQARALDRLGLGREVATTLGLPVARFSRALLVVCVALTAGAVALSGMLAFVGLIAPHVARRLVGGAHTRLVPTATLCGVLLVVSAEVTARVAFEPREVPVGLLTAVIGGPLFLLLTLREAV